MPLIVIHRDERIEAFLTKHQISPHRALDIDAFRLQPLHQRLDDAIVIIAEETAFAGMGIDAEHAKPRTRDAEIAQGVDR